MFKRKLESGKSGKSGKSEKTLFEMYLEDAKRREANDPNHQYTFAMAKKELTDFFGREFGADSICDFVDKSTGELGKNNVHEYERGLFHIKIEEKIYLGEFYRDTVRITAGIFQEIKPLKGLKEPFRFLGGYMSCHADDSRGFKDHQWSAPITEIAKANLNAAIVPNLDHPSPELEL